MANKDGNQEDRYDTDDEKTKTKKVKGASGSATHERGTANDWTKSGTKMPKSWDDPQRIRDENAQWDRVLKDAIRDRDENARKEAKSAKKARRSKAKAGRTADARQGSISGESVSPVNNAKMNQAQKSQNAQVRSSTNAADRAEAPSQEPAGRTADARQGSISGESVSPGHNTQMNHAQKSHNSPVR